MLNSEPVPLTASGELLDISGDCGFVTLLEVHDLTLLSVVEELVPFFDGGKYVAYLVVNSLSFPPRAPGV